jgi:hypothetical protein
MRVMNQALTVGLDFPGDVSPTTGPGSEPPPRSQSGLAPLHGGVPGASGPLGRCALAYMDDCLVHSPTLEQHLLDFAEVLEIFRRRKLFAKSSKCEFGRRELGFLGHRLSEAGVSVDPRARCSRSSSERHQNHVQRSGASQAWPTTTAVSWKAMLRSRPR